jgi:DNA replication and repair protein RecF
MVAVTKLNVINFRSHKNISVNLSPDVTVITGKNGSGKTSLLEAIYIALQGSSFKGTDKDVLKNDTPWWRIEIILDDESKRLITFDPEKIDRKKSFNIDNKISFRMPAKSKIPVVLFEPEDLRLINGSPSRRRQFIDKLICQINPLYSKVLRKYERAIIQRNNLLKKNPSNDDLFVWDVALSEYGAEIIKQRNEMTQNIDKKLENMYQKISKKADKVSIKYQTPNSEITSQKLLKELNLSAERDKYTGNTSVGPHRHDVIFKFNNSLASTTASRGETRTIIVALKLIEAGILNETYGYNPIIMLDDVFSELDEDRQGSIASKINQYQVIITDTKVPDPKVDTVTL